MVKANSQSVRESKARRDLRFLRIIETILAGEQIGKEADWLNKVEEKAHAILGI